RPGAERDAGEKGGGGFGVSCRTEQSGAVFEDHADRRIDEQLAQAALVGEGFHEGAVVELFQDLGSDAPANVEAAHGKNFQREVTSFSAISGDKHVEGFFTDFTFRLERQFRDYRV